MSKKVLYSDMTWPEVKEAAKDGRIPLIPIGSTEQHGLHLPLKTDAFIVEELCKEVASRIPDMAMVMPCIYYGYNEHHLDFPATIHIDHETLIRFVVNIGRSLAHHGFKKIIIVNGHGSNTALMEIAARRITLETQAICASLMYLALEPKVFQLIEGEEAHGGDIETSIMLYLAPNLVNTKLAERYWDIPKSRFIRWGVEPRGADFAVSGGAVQFMDWWSRISKDGTLGDPTKATSEKGKMFFELYVNALIDFIKEFREREIKPRKDHH
jgi:creatinine amidohydrolase